MTTGTEVAKSEESPERSMPRLKSHIQSEQKNEAQGISPELSAGDPLDAPPPADWLEPLDDFEEEENDGDWGFHMNGLEKEGTERDVLKRIHQDGLSVTRQRRRRHTGLDDLWTDWPILGKGWKRRKVYRRAGGVGRTDTYYMSPDGVRFRSKVELAKHLHLTDLSSFHYGSGLFLNGTKTKQRHRGNNSEDRTASKHSPPPEQSSTPTVEPGTPQSTTQSCITTPQRLNRMPDSDPHSPSSNFGSPPHLSPISPLVQQSSRSPSLHLGHLSPITSPKKLASNALLAQTWLDPGLEPVSPIQLPKKQDRSAPPNDQIPVRVPPRFPSPPVTRRTMDHNMTLTGQARKCDNCACIFPAVGKEKLCTSCTTMKKLTSPSQSIVFKKIGHGQWALSKPSNLKPESKTKNTEHDKKSHSWKSQRLSELNSKKRPQNSDSEDNEGYTAEVVKKRKRRMCFKCEPCCRSDCGKCDHCIDKPKFGGLNKKRQKCRLRQCIYEAGEKYRIQVRPYKKKPPTFQEFKPTRPRSKRLQRRPVWEEDYTDPEDDEVKKQRRRRDSVDRDEEERDEDDEDYGLFELENDISNDLSGPITTEELSSYMYPMDFQNENLQIDSSYLQINGSQGPVVVYSLAGTAEGAVGLSEDVQGMSVNRSAMVEEDPLDFSPTMSQLFSLADGSEPLEGSGELELKNLLSALRRTVLPAHWMAVLAKGPALQLLQCSRRSAMADTLLQIEPGFCYGLSVQGQPLPPAHPVYERHPARLTSVSLVVEVLLDLEGLAVCQGYPWGLSLAVRPRTNEAILCVRATACQLLVDPEEKGEHCDRCHPPSSDT